jgi:poly(A)-specific ribonuclease
MTGISQGNNNILDYPDGRYGKYKNTAEKFKIIQLGVVPWKKVQSEDGKPSYNAKPYNIYVFPDEEYGLVTCETSALIFNKDHGMDFNKWIYKGK